jgi:hypothetical protein
MVLYSFIIQDNLKDWETIMICIERQKYGKVKEY